MWTEEQRCGDEGKSRRHQRLILSGIAERGLGYNHRFREARDKTAVSVHSPAPSAPTDNRHIPFFPPRRTGPMKPHACELEYLIVIFSPFNMLRGCFVNSDLSPASASTFPIFERLQHENGHQVFFFCA